MSDAGGSGQPGEDAQGAALDNNYFGSREDEQAQQAESPKLPEEIQWVDPDSRLYQKNIWQYHSELQEEMDKQQCRDDNQQDQNNVQPMDLSLPNPENSETGQAHQADNGDFSEVLAEAGSEGDEVQENQNDGQPIDIGLSDLGKSQLDQASYGGISEELDFSKVFGVVGSQGEQTQQNQNDGQPMGTYTLDLENNQSE